MIRRARTLLISIAVLTACASAPEPAPKVATDVPDKPVKPLEVAAPPAEVVTDVEPGGAVPVTRSDAMRGDALAPVTIVMFGDYQCPFTARLVATMGEIERRYGPDKVRFVWKNFALPFHPNAKPAATAAEAVRALAGNAAFWSFFTRAFENQRELSPERYEAWAADVGVARRDLRDAIEAGSFASLVDRDHDLGERLGVSGTPATFVNGVFLSGAQPRERFEEEIDRQLVAAEELVRSGVPRARVYATLSDRNWKAPKKPEPSSTEIEDTAVWRVPVDGSPVRGKATALVTIVEFSDLQCPFCSRVHPTVAAVQREYGDKVRVVWKNQPLPFHPRAEPAAEVALEARAEKGDAGFWSAVDLLFTNQARLADDDLLGYARTLGLDERRVRSAIATHAHKKLIDRDTALAEEVKAQGTPHFFVNGRRLVGAQPIEKFRTIVDAELAKAEALVRAGTPAAKVYDAIQRDAKSAAPFERVVVPAPTKANAAKGAPPGAKVVVQMFADFQFPFCKRAQATIDDLVKAHPREVRVVFRHHPLPFHDHAALASEAAIEAQAQKGDAGFWAMADKLWAAQGTPDGLARAGLEQAAAEIGLDLRRFRAALDQRTHRAAVEADTAIAEKASLSGTPAFAVNDYFVSGAQPLATFERAVKKALGPKEPIAPGSLHGAPHAEPATPPPPPVPPTQPAAGPLFGAKHLVVMYAGSSRAPASVTRTKAEARARADEALRKLRSGARFEDVVAAYSDGPGATARGGDLGSFPHGAMVPEFQGAVEALSVGQTSGIVESPFGFHIIVRTK
jgi:protein-disulfide isomerase